MEAEDLLHLLPQPSRSRRNKFVLLAGFGALLALLVALGALAVSTLQRAASADSEHTREYLERRRMLGDARTSLIVASGAVRDFLLDPDASQTMAHEAETRAAWAQVRDRLEAYRRVKGMEAAAGPAIFESVALDQLIAHALATAPVVRRRSGYHMLSETITPARDRLLARLEELARADQQALNETVRQTAADLRMLQDRLRAAIGLSIVLGLVVAAFAYRHFVRLEELAAERYRHACRSAERSEQLSHRLLTVQEQERKRLARELHDEVGQSLGAVLVDLGQARAELEQNPAEARARLEGAVANGEHTMRVVRDISLLLRPTMLDELGLIPALHWQAREVSRRNGLATSVRSDDDDLALDEELRTTVFRVVQEALQNAAKHSGARSAEVGIAARDGRLRIMVTDNGKGFDPALARGLGLLGMEERVARLGGTLRVSSAPAQGTTITADLPIRKGNTA